MPEQVLIVQNNLLHSHIQCTTGCLITEDKEQIFNKILDNQLFMPRNEAEYNFEHKQVIPYVIVRNNGRYLLLKRTAKQAEKRLHNKFSLGIGGHVNPDSSADEKDILINSLYRELHEEVHVNDPGNLNFIGIINDESNSVSKVHLGLLYVLETLSSDYQVLETDKMTAQWVSEDNLQEYYDGFETWSQIVYEQYIKKGA
jgi:predicted NUDIX family phosphoesterase